MRGDGVFGGIDETVDNSLELRVWAPLEPFGGSRYEIFSKVRI